MKYLKNYYVLFFYNHQMLQVNQMRLLYKYKFILINNSLIGLLCLQWALLNYKQRHPPVAQPRKCCLPMPMSTLPTSPCMPTGAVNAPSPSPPQSPQSQTPAAPAETRKIPSPASPPIHCPKSTDWHSRPLPQRPRPAAPSEWHWAESAEKTARKPRKDKENLKSYKKKTKGKPKGTYGKPKETKGTPKGNRRKPKKW